MFCRYCGNELPDDAQFCNACGKPVDTGQQELLPNFSQTDSSEVSLADELKKNSLAKTGAWILIGCIMAIICIAVGGIVLNSRPTERDTTNINGAKNNTESDVTVYNRDKTSPESETNSNKESSSSITYEELIGCYTDGPANEIGSSELSIDIYDTTLEISYGSYRGGSGTFDVVFDSESKWPKIENNSIQSTAEESFWDCTYHLTLIFVPASESSTGADTIYLEGSELFENCVYIRDAGESANNNYDDPSTWDNYPEEDGEEYFISDNPTDYDARQYYGNVGLYSSEWEKENPYGYFKHGYFNLDNLFGMYASQTTQFEFDSGLSIDYLKETNEIAFKYYLSYSKMRPETEPDMQFRMDADDVIGKNSWSFVPNDEERIDFEIVYLDKNNLHLTYDPNFTALCIRVDHTGPYEGEYFMFDNSFYIQYFYKDDKPEYESYGEQTENFPDLPVNLSGPYGYYEKADGMGGLSIEYISDDDSVRIEYYSDGQPGFYGGQWFDCDFYMGIATTIDFSSDNVLDITDGNGNVLISLVASDRYITLTAPKDLYGVPTSRINGDYYCKTQYIFQ